MTRLWTLAGFLLCMSTTAVIYQSCDESLLQKPDSDTILASLAGHSNEQDRLLCENLAGEYLQGFCSVNMSSASTLNAVHSRACQQLGGLWSSEKSPKCLLFLSQRHRYHNLIFNIKTQLANKKNDFEQALEISRLTVLQQEDIKTSSHIKESSQDHLTLLIKNLGILRTRLNKISLPFFTQTRVMQNSLNQLNSSIIDLIAIITGPLTLNQHVLEKSSLVTVKLNKISNELRLFLQAYSLLLENFGRIVSISEGIQKKLNSHPIDPALPQASLLSEINNLKSLKFANSQTIDLGLMGSARQINRKLKVLQSGDKTKHTIYFLNFLLADNYQFLLNLMSLLGPPLYRDQSLISAFSQVNILEARIRKIEASGVTKNELLPLSKSLNEDFNILIQFLQNTYEKQPSEKVLNIISQLDKIREQLLLKSGTVMEFIKTISLYSGSVKKNLQHTRPILNGISDFGSRTEDFYALFENNNPTSCQESGGFFTHGTPPSCQLNLFKQIKIVKKETEACQTNGPLKILVSCPASYKLIQCFGSKGAYIQKNDLLKPQNDFQSYFHKDTCALTVENPACVSSNKEHSAKVIAHCAQWRGQHQCPSNSIWSHSKESCVNINPDFSPNQICPDNRVMTFGQCVHKPKISFHIPLGLCSKDNPLGFPSRCTCQKDFSYEPELGLCLKDL